jgi:hypothetical protein
LQYFSGIFPESRNSAQKQDTGAILLKTTLVHVSCIQNTQIRGETIAKVFGKLDMFWTYQTLKAMNISLEWLKPTDCSFHGIVPGSANHPLGKIKIDVCFGDSGNFPREKLAFEVMDWPS